MKNKTNSLKQNLKNVSKHYTSSHKQHNEESSKERPIWQEILIASSGPIIIHLGQKVIDKVFDWLHPENKEEDDEKTENKENSDIKVTPVSPTPEENKEKDK